MIVKCVSVKKKLDVSVPLVSTAISCVKISLCTRMLCFHPEPIFKNQRLQQSHWDYTRSYCSQKPDVCRCLLVLCPLSKWLHSECLTLQHHLLNCDVYSCAADSGDENMLNNGAGVALLARLCISTISKITRATIIRLVCQNIHVYA